MKICNDLLMAGIYNAAVTAAGQVTLKGLAVPDSVRVASLSLDTILRQDALDESGRIVGIETAILRCAERNQRARDEQRAKDKERDAAITESAVALLAQVQAFDMTGWNLKPLQFEVHCRPCGTLGASLDSNSTPGGIWVSGYVPSDIAAQIKAELRALQNYRAQINQRAQEIADAEITRRIRKIDQVVDGGMYVRQGRAFVRFVGAMH